MNATQIRKGMAVLWNGELHVVQNVDHITPGNWRAIIQIKMRNQNTGAMIEQRFKSSDRLEVANTDKLDAEYLYATADKFVFMNMTSYEEIYVPKEWLEGQEGFLKPNLPVQILTCEGEPRGVEFPTTIELKVVKTEPGLKGATVTNVYKPAECDTGFQVQVPPFIEEGEIIRIDTRDGSYVERVKS